MFMGFCVYILFEFVASVSNARTETATATDRNRNNHSPEEVGAAVRKGSWANYGGAEINTAGRNSVIFVFSPILATIMLKYRIVSKKTNLSYLNCLIIFYEGVAELAFKICYNCYFLQREIQPVKQYHT